MEITNDCRRACNRSLVVRGRRLKRGRCSHPVGHPTCDYRARPWESRRPDSQPPCSAAPKVKGGRRREACGVLAERHEAPLMPGAVLQTVVQRVGGSEVGGGRVRSPAVVQLAHVRRLERGGRGALRLAPGARSGRGARRAGGPERGAPRSGGASYERTRDLRRVGLFRSVGRVRQELEDLLRTAAGGGDLGGPLQRLLA
jgi:hypothetical protein